MVKVFSALLRSLLSGFQSHSRLALENLALRHQLAVLQRQAPKPKLRLTDRLLWVGLLRFWPDWRQALLLVQPQTVIAWHRLGFRLFWRWKSRARGGRPSVDGDLIALIRQMWQANPTAVMLLFMMNQRGANAQDWFTKVGDHYHLPMISYRDALWPEIQAGRLTWRDISPDEVHPNDHGHADAARFVTCLLDQAWKSLPTDDALTPIPLLPAPRFTDLFEHTALAEADALKPMTNSGWSFDAKSHCWKSEQPGSTIEFEIEGQAIFTMHYVVRGPMGRARVSVDGTTAKELEAWFDQTWGGYRQTRQVAHSLAAGKHRVRFDLLPDASKGSTGHEFRILGLGTAGAREKD